MDVRIRFDRVEPPEGRLIRMDDDAGALAPGGGGTPFVGWLGLLRALAEVIEPPDDEDHDI